MRRALSPLIVSVIVLFVCTGPAHAISVQHPSLGWWDNGTAGSTHQYWDFTPSYVTAGGVGYTATPEELINPDPFNVLATITPAGSYDGDGGFSSTRYLAVNIELPNWSTQNPYKEIWVDLGTNATISLEDIGISAGPTNIAYDIQLLEGQNGADFGVRIWPNPYIEKIQFVLFPPTPTTAVFPVTLDYIQIDTICIPEPATLAMLAFGGFLLRRRLA
jgi:hypothetical protein